MNPRTEYDTCVGCDGTAWTLLTPGSARSFEALLRHHWWGHVSWGIVPVFVLALAWAELTLYVEHAKVGVAALAASWLTAHALAATFLALVQDTARGPDEWVRSESIEVISEAVIPAIPLALLLVGWLWLPTIAERLGFSVHHGIWNPLFALPGVALGVALPGIGIRTALRLGGAAPAELRLPRSILVLGGVAGLFMHLFLFSSAWALRIGLWWWVNPLLGLWGVADPFRMFAGLTVLLLARATGFMLHTRAAALGFPLPERYQVPVLPGVTPRGKREAAAPVKPARSHESIEL